MKKIIIKLLMIIFCLSFGNTALAQKEDFAVTEMLKQKYGYVSFRESGTIYNKLGYSNYWVKTNGFKDKTMGMCDVNGNEIIAPGKYTIVDYMHPKEDNIIEISIGNKTGFCDYKGRIIFETGKYDRIRNYGFYYEVFKGDKSGICNMNGKEIIPPKYDNISNAGVGFIVEKSGKYNFIWYSGFSYFQGFNVTEVSYNANTGALIYRSNDNDKDIEIKNTGLLINIAKASKEYMQNYPFSFFAKIYVEDSIKEWQKKGEFENITKWQERVTEEERNSKIQYFLKKAENIYTEQRQNMLPMVFSVGEYDADNQTYRITSPSFSDMFIAVPVNQAQSFKDNFDKMNRNISFCVENDILGISKIVFQYQNLAYEYNNQSSLNYAIANIDYNFDPIDLNLADNSNQKKGKQTISTVNVNIGKSDVDINIPSNGIKNDKTFAVIISNENYQRESQVEFANNDGKTFKEYCSKALGLPENNIHYIADATLNNIRAEINWISGVAQAYNGEANIIFYYAGHGIPDESSKTAYLLPIDGYGSDVTTGYKIDDLYQKLGSLSAKAVTVFMDACFSGAQRSGAMLASARGVAIKTAQGKPSGNMVVFSAAQGDETAYPYKEKGHGLFTYFLLKKLQESKGNVTLGELNDFITTNVKQQSIVVNSKSQTPTVIPSAALGESWKNKKLK
jgi:hypothetical protein